MLRQPHNVANSGCFCLIRGMTDASTPQIVEALAAPPTTLAGGLAGDHVGVVGPLDGGDPDGPVVVHHRSVERTAELDDELVGALLRQVARYFRAGRRVSQAVSI